MSDEYFLLSIFKLKADSFFSPLEDGVYIRNNLGYFTIKGKNAYQWLTSLAPYLNGSTNVKALMNNLSDSHSKMTLKIIKILWEKGFLENIIEEHYDELTTDVQKYYSSQINFIQYFQEQAISKFVNYRNSKTLIIGDGTFLNSIVNAALESGLSNLSVLPISQNAAILDKRSALLKFYQEIDPKVGIFEYNIYPEEMLNKIREIIVDHDSILYVSKEANLKLIYSLNYLCKELNKNLIVASHLENVVIVGPLIIPNNNGCLECMLRMMQRSYIERDNNQHFACENSEAILANLAIFELFKHITTAIEPAIYQKVYILNLETLEGEHHFVLPHPLCQTCCANNNLLCKSSLPPPTANLDEQIKFLNNEANSILLYFAPSNLNQLPLSQYKIQVAALTGTGPSLALPIEVISDVTNETAKREAFLRALEAYFSQYIDYFPLAGKGEQTRIFDVQKCELDSSPVLQQGSNQWVECINISKDSSKVHIPFSISSYAEITANQDKLPSYMNVAVGKNLHECVVRGIEKIINKKLTTSILQQNISFDKVNIENSSDTVCSYLMQLVSVNFCYYICQSFYGFHAIVIFDQEQNRMWIGAAMHLTKALKGALVRCIADVQNDVSQNAIIINKELCRTTFTSRQHNISIDPYEESFEFETKAMKDLLAQYNKEIIFVEYKNNLTSVLVNFTVSTVMIIENMV